MTWAKLSDAFYDDPDTDRLSLPAVAAYCLALSWCGKHETDGHISEDRLVLLARGKRSVIPELLAENAKGESFLVRCDDGLLVRNWAKYQPTKDQIAASRRAAADRQAKARGHK